MAIIINIDVMLAKRKMSVTELSEKVGITLANISVLKNGKAKAASAAAAVTGEQPFPRSDSLPPELEPDALRRDRMLREQVDLDSMDWLNVIVGFHERFGVDIPEADYVKLTTLDAIVAYLAGRLP